MPEVEVKSNHPACDSCVRASYDAYWCETHDNPIGDSSDGWAGCTKAMVTDARAFLDAFERRETEALELIGKEGSTQEEYNAYEQVMVDSVAPGLKLSAFLFRLDEDDDGWPGMEIQPPTSSV